MTRTTLPRTILTATALTAIALPLAGVTANLADAATAPSARATQVKVTPTGFDRGADAEVPLVLGGKVVDGDTTLPVPGSASELVRKDSAGYVVLTQIDDRDHLVRVAEGADPVDLRTLPYPAEVASASDGSTVFASVYRNGAQRSVITAIDAATGKTLGKRTFQRYAYVVDGTSELALVSRAKGSRTSEWTIGGGVREVSDQQAYYADITTNTLALFTGDPYDGGCTRVVPVDRPGRTLWRDCDAAVISSAPGGRTATVFILSDGPGPNEVTVRTPDGRVATTYTNPKGTVGVAGWEPGGSALLSVNGPRNGALVRCDGADCERASDLFDTTLA